MRKTKLFFFRHPYEPLFPARLQQTSIPLHIVARVHYVKFCVHGGALLKNTYRGGLLRLREALKVACSRLSDSGEGAKEWGMGKTRKCKARENRDGAGKFPPVFFFFFVFALSQFRGPDYLGG